MKLLFKQRVFSLFGNFDIYDETGAELYHVKGKFAFGQKLIVHDINGNPIAKVRERLFTIRPQFKIYEGDTYIGKIVKRITLFTPKFKMTFSNWTVKGNFFQLDYHILSGEKVVATISKEILHLGDTYQINVADPNDALRALLVVLSIDAAKQRRDRRRSTNFHS